MASRLETGLNVVIAVAAIAIAAGVVRREFFNRADNDKLTDNTPVYIPEWRTMLGDGLRLGPPTAVVQIVEFVDLECPFCADWHSTVLQDVLGQSEDDVSFTMLHYPLPTHRFARHAAIALECAASQNRFGEFLSVVLSKQDSIGLKSWWSYAEESLVADSAQFAQCVSGPPAARIEAGERWAERLSVNSTPTFLINGWRLPYSPRRQDISRIIRAAKSGEEIFPDR